MKDLSCLVKVCAFARTLMRGWLGWSGVGWARFVHLRERSLGGGLDLSWLGKVRWHFRRI